MQFQVMLNNYNHAISGNGRKYLDSYGSLDSTPEEFNFQMLFDTFKEEFYMPAIFKGVLPVLQTFPYY
jgi:hypothetical protein